MGERGREPSVSDEGVSARGLFVENPSDDCATCREAKMIARGEERQPRQGRLFRLQLELALFLPGEMKAPEQPRLSKEANEFGLGLDVA